MESRRPTGSRFVARFAPIALLLLLPGLGELHAPGDLHFEPAGSKAYFPVAEHPDQPRHVEAGQEAEHPECAACLHRLESRGGAPTARTASAAPADSGVAPTAGLPAPRAGIAATVRGRAPPSLLV